MNRRALLAFTAFCFALFAFAANADAQLVTGTVTQLDGETPIQGVPVNVYTTTGGFVASTSTDIDGAYSMSPGAGTYYVHTNAGSGYINRSNNGSFGVECGACAPTFSGGGPAGAATVLVPGSGSVSANFRLQQGPTIGGTVRRADTNLGVSGVSTFLYNSTGFFVSSGFTDVNGVYTIGAGLPPGTYYLVTSNNLGWIDEAYDNVPCPLFSCSVTSGNALTIVATAISNADFTLNAGARVSGQVTNSTTTLGINGAQVQIYNSVGNLVGSAFTDGSGNFTSGGIPTGTYFFRASGGGRVPKLHSGINCVGCAVTSGTAVNLVAAGAPAAPTAINFSLDAGGTITGTVTNTSAATVSGSNVTVYDATGTFVSQSTTNGSGVYTVSGLLPGEYFVRAFPPGAAGTSTLISRLYNGFDCPSCDVTTGTPVTIATLGATTSGIDMVMTAGAILTGQVTGPSGNVAGLQMTVLNASGGTVGTVTTNGSGVYTYNGLLPGTYFVRTATTVPGGLIPEIFKGAGLHEPCYSCNINVGTGLAVTSGSTTADFSLLLGGTLTGTVRSSASGTPAIQNVSVQVFSTSSNQQLVQATTNAGGVYTITGLPTGNYAVRTTNVLGFIDKVYNNIVCLSCTASTSGTPVAVTAGVTTSPIDFSLSPGGRISGRITDAVTGLGITGSGTSARVYNTAGVQVASGATDAAGNYTTGTGLPTGNYFAVSFNNLGYIDELYDGIGCFGCSVVSGTPIAVEQGGTTPNVNLALSVGGGITGNVKRAADNQAIAWAGVQLYSATGSFLRSSSTNSSGAFGFTGLPTGTYFVRTGASYYGYIDQLFSAIGCNNCSATTGTPINVTAGGTVSLGDFLLQSGATISGTVRDFTTTGGIANVTVNAYAASGVFAQSTSTAPDGTYTIKGLQTGTYFLVTSNSLNYINQVFASPSGIDCSLCTATSGTGISVVVGTTNATGRDFSLKVGGRITGRVTSNGTTGIGGVTMTLYSSTGSFVTTTSTTSNGDYVFAGLNTGSYLIRTSNGQGFIDQVFDNLECLGCTPTTGTAVAVTAGSTTSGRNFILAAGGRIRGTVNDSSGNPIAGVTVQIFRSTGGSAVTTATTNASGAWISNAGLPAGTYVARTSNSLGYADQLYNGVSCLGCNVISGAPIVLPAGGLVENIDFALPPGGSITGVVTAAGNGTPLQGINVQVFSSANTQITSSSTNGSGVFLLRGLPGGQYYLKTFNSQGYVDQIYSGSIALGGTPANGTPVSVTVGSTTTGVNFMMATGNRVVGTVRSGEPGNPPIGGVTVQIYTRSGAFAASATTSPSGSYVVGGLPAGSYYARTFNQLGFVNLLFPAIICNSCSVTAGTLVVVPDAGSATADFTLPVGGAISGTIRDASTSAFVPPGGASVSIYTTQGAFAASASVGSNGVYTVGGLPTGTYVARTSNSVGLINQQFNSPAPCVSCNFSSGTPIAVTAGSQRTGIDFNLSPGARISGTVRDAASNAALPGVSVQVYSNSNAFVTSATTDNTGAYVTTAGLPAGTYYARTTGANGYIGMLYNGIPCQNCAPNSGTPIVVASSNVTGIDFNLTLGGRITGRITDAGGAPLQGVSVSVYLATGEFVASGSTNFDGNYTTQGMPTGTYYLRTGNGLGYINQVYNNVTCVRCSVTIGTPVSVTVGATTPNINFALNLGGRISGIVTDAASGQPAGGVSIQVFDSSGFVVTTAVSNNGGAYISSAGLTAGNYYVRATSNAGYVTQIYNGVICTTCDARTGTPVAVSIGTTTSNINFAMVLGGRITGTITGTRIDPLTGGTVTGPLPDIEVSVFSSGGTFVTFAMTGTDGRFITNAGLQTGNYFLATYNQSGYIDQLYKTRDRNGTPITTPTPCGTNCAITSGEEIAVVLGATTFGKDFVLAQGGRIEGIVTRQSTGNPLNAVPVYIYDSSGIPTAFGFTDGTGRYVSDSGLPAGTYYVGTQNKLGLIDRVHSNVDCAGCDVRTGDAITVTAGATVTGINLVLGDGELVSGTVTTTDGAPLVNAAVRFFSSTGKFVTQAATNEAGGYTTPTALPAGTYFARTVNGAGFIDKLYDVSEFCLACDVTRGTPIVVDGAGTTTGINFALPQGGRISGIVLGVSSSGNIPVAGTKVRVFSSSGSLVGESFTNGLGLYTSPGLPIGNYFVRTYNPAGFIDQIYNSAGNADCAPCSIVQASAVAVVQGGVRTGIDFLLTGGGLVSGYVINQATGSPIQGVTVAVYRASDGVLVATTDPTNASGYYQVSLPVGTYQVEPNPVAGFRPALPLSGLRGPLARSTVTVDTDSETTGIGFALVACAPITVTPSTLPLAAQGQLYSSTFTASGGSGSYSFSVSDGTVNTGLALNSAGLLAGAPVFAGTGNFTVAAMDSNQCAGTRTFALTACSFFLSTPSLSTTANAGSGTVQLTALAADCPWMITTTDPWITVTSAVNGTGNATVAFSYAFNSTGAARSGTLRIGGQVFTITQGSPSSTPAFGVVDTPAQGATGVNGSLGVTGWALDDIEVRRVVVSRDPVAGEGLTGDVYLGDATMVEGARPDVAAANPTLPFNTRAGWGYLLLTNMLPNQGNGTYTLHIDAHDAEGAVTRLGSRTFVADNASAVAPFGAIDTPGQGATISGTNFVNFGWALTPNPKSIPTNGSTITVFVDSVPAGNPTYNNFRADVAGLFPGLANTAGAIGFKEFDTTTLTNGVHTISWVVFDDAGQGQGIGSRYFTVNNILASQRFAPPALASLRAHATAAATPAPQGPPVSLRVGFDRNQPMMELGADSLGGRFVAVGQLGRMELRFGQACGVVKGVQIANGERTALPVGSTLDGSGSFHWMPGPAFLGSYELEFTVPSCDGSETRIPVSVAVLPGR